MAPGARFLRRVSRHLALALPLAAALAGAAAPAAAQVVRTAPETPELRFARSLAEVPTLELEAVDPQLLLRRDEERVMAGGVPHFAVALPVDVDPWSSGSWEPLGLDLAGRQLGRWRHRIVSRGALSLSLAFGRFRLPEGGRLRLASADGRLRLGPWTATDEDAHGQLWTPPMPGDELLLELVAPVDDLDEIELRLTAVHHGYAGFGDPAPRAGGCNLDVACADAEPWHDVARSVALVAIEGVRYCSGFLVNNTALDGVPYFITAEHCGVDAANAASVVVIWSYESPRCRDAVEPLPVPREAFRSYQSGAVLRATVAATDTVLLELDDPPPPSSGAFFAGWDRRHLEPRGAAVVHHPNTDWKRVAIDLDRARATPHLESRRGVDGGHLRIGDWELGTTEGGSSGAPLLNRAKRVVGQLHGGYAACGNRAADWFGRFADAWSGDGRRGHRLSDWLDPRATGAVVLDGLDASVLPPTR